MNFPRGQSTGREIEAPGSQSEGLKARFYLAKESHKSQETLVPTQRASKFSPPLSSWVFDSQGCQPKLSQE